MLRPASEVADMDTRLGPADRHFHPVFQHSRRHNASFIRDLCEAGVVDFVEDAVEHVGLFRLLGGSSLMRVQAITFF